MRRRRIRHRPPRRPRRDPRCEPRSRGSRIEAPRCWRFATADSATRRSPPRSGYGSPALGRFSAARRTRSGGRSPHVSDIEDMLSVPEAQVDTERALARLRARVEAERIAPVTRGGSAPRRIGVNIWLRGLAAAATVALVATLLTVSGLAETILTIFEPKQLVAVPITVTDLNGAASFGAYGTLTWTEQPKPYDVPDVRTAAHDRGLTVLVPSNLPAGVRAPRYGVMNKTTATFTFSADKTNQAAAAP